MHRLSPIVFANLSREFAAAARREHDIAANRVSMPAYFLVGRAIELGLKSYLLLRGQDDVELRRISHDLDKALEAANREGLASTVAIDSSVTEGIAWLNEYYRRKDLEYPVTGYKSYPPIDGLLAFADTLFSGLETQRRAWRPADG